MRIVECCETLAGRWAGMLLAEQGAQVIRLIAPEKSGDTAAQLTLEASAADASEAQAAYADRGKQLWQPQDSQALAQLFAGADGVLCDAPMLAALNLTDAELPAQAVQVRIVSGLANAPAPLPDGCVHARCGVYSDVSLTVPLLGLPPLYTALPMASAYGAVHAALAMLSGLRLAERGRPGQVLEMPQIQSTLAAMSTVLLQIKPQPWRYDLPPLPRIFKPLLAAVRWIGKRTGQRTQQKLRTVGHGLIPPMMRFYRGADGQWLYVFAMDHRRLPLSLLQTLGIWDELHAQGLQAADPLEVGMQRNNLCDPALLAPRWKKHIARALAHAFAREPAYAWEARLTQAGIPCAVAQTSAQWRTSAFAREAGLMQTLHDPLLGEVTQPCISVQLTNVSSGTSSSTPPIKPRQWLSAAPQWAPRSEGMSLTPAESSIAPSALPLAGIKVLDLSTMVAGPVCARSLAELGAEVIKIDAPTPLHGPRMTAWYAADVSHGKRSVLLNWQTPAGAAVLRQLCQSAQVLVHNFTGAAAQRITEIIAGLPIIACRISAFGGPECASGEALHRDRKGYDPVLQAATGVALRYGGADTPELHGIASCVDGLTGYLAAFGVLCALCGASTNRLAVSHVHISLAQAVQFMQNEFLVADESLPPSATGPCAVGRNALQRIYKTRNGWIYLHASAITAPGLVGQAVEKDEPAEGQIAHILGELFAKLSTAEALVRCQTAGIPVAPVQTMAYWRNADSQDVMHIPAPISPQTGKHTITRVRANWLRAPDWHLAAGAAFPKLGQDSHSVLADGGFSSLEINELIAQGVLAESLHPRYLPD